jgi:hypothetical protein
LVQYIVYGISIFGLLAIAFAVAVKMTREDNKNKIRREKEAEAVAKIEPPRCVTCSELATDPFPLLERVERNWLSAKISAFFDLPLRYHRLVSSSGPLLCRSHAHTADAMMDHFIQVGVRGIYAEANKKIAIASAHFEMESLKKELAESLTEDQKKTLKKATTQPARSNVVPFGKTGTDNERASGSNEDG